MKTKLIIALFGLLALAAVPQTAFAHVLIRDNTKSVGAVLHIDPDDDPVAGQKSNLFFDIEGQTIKKDSAHLKITNTTTNQIVDAPVTFTSTSVTALYTFPSQAAYNLELTIESPNSKMYTFEYAQRVARGVSTSQLQSTTYPLATIGLILSATGLLLTAIVVSNRRKQISIYSKF